MAEATIASRVAERMDLLGVTWTEIARSCGVDRRTLYNYQREGWYDARLYTLLRVASCLRANVGWLIGGSLEAPPHRPPNKTKQCPVCCTWFRRYGITSSRPSGRSRCRRCDGYAVEGAPRLGSVSL